ncbi:MAG TPA: neutral zinc metallopeptidase [Pyrinomonadaceae bacterium]|jgi:hypothetical protein
MTSRTTLGIPFLASIVFVAVVLALPVDAVKPLEPAVKRDLPLPTLLAAAANDINGFWQWAFNSTGRAYAPPQMVAYTGQINTPCGVLQSNNAAYCQAAHTIYYDYNFINRSYTNVGDYAAVGIIAHEWGHVVQAHLGISRGNSYSIQMELQADCFMGAYTKYAERTGKLEPGDLDEAGEDLFKSGDPKGMPWFASQAHGSPLQRVGAFLDGYNERPCFPRR